MPTIRYGLADSLRSLRLDDDEVDREFVHWAARLVEELEFRARELALIHVGDHDELGILAGRILELVDDPDVEPRPVPVGPPPNAKDDVFITVGDFWSGKATTFQWMDDFLTFRGINCSEEVLAVLTARLGGVHPIEWRWNGRSHKADARLISTTLSFDDDASHVLEARCLMETFREELPPQT